MKVFILLIIGIWIGMLIGISFVEAPLKFQAPNITLTLGLGIGQLVFSALNKFEIIFSICLSLWMISKYKISGNFTPLFLVIPIVCVALQSFWLLPELSERVEQLLNGESLPTSNLHMYYVILEVSKVVFLIMSFIKIYPNE